MPRVVHFEIGILDPNRAVPFYEKVFGWEIKQWEGGDGYFLVRTGPDGEPGIDGALMKVQNSNDFQTINTIDVPSVDEYLAKVAEHGGKALSAKMEIPGVGHFAYCEDTEGNRFGIIQFAPRNQ